MVFVRTKESTVTTDFSLLSEADDVLNFVVQSTDTLTPVDHHLAPDRA